MYESPIPTLLMGKKLKLIRVKSSMAQELRAKALESDKHWVRI